MRVQSALAAADEVLQVEEAMSQTYDRAGDGMAGERQGEQAAAA